MRSTKSMKTMSARAKAKAAIQARPHIKSNKPGKKTRVRITKRMMRKAIRGSLGNKTEIARRLHVRHANVCSILKRERWDNIRAVYQAELEFVADAAENTVYGLMMQRKDTATAGRLATWVLTRARHKDRNLMDVSKMILEGGDKPVRIDQMPIETLDLPLDVRKAILLAVEAKIKEKEGKD